MYACACVCCICTLWSCRVNDTCHASGDSKDAGLCFGGVFNLASSLALTPWRRWFFFFFLTASFFSERITTFPAKTTLRLHTLVSSCTSIHPGWAIQLSHVGEVSGNRRSCHSCASAGLVTPVKRKHCSSFNSAREIGPTHYFSWSDLMLVPPCNAAVQLRSESRIRLIAGTRTLQRDYLRRLSDDIFMCCSESCGRWCFTSLI